MLGHATLHKELREAEQHVIGPQATGDINGQTLACLFIDDRQQLYRSSILCPSRHEVIRPPMVRSFRSETNARAIREPEPPPRWLLLRHLPAFAPPDSLDPFVV